MKTDMKKFIIFSVLILLFSILFVSCENKENTKVSEYESLTQNQKEIVDTIFANKDRFSHCNGVKFEIHNGKRYFVATYAEMKDNVNVFEAAGLIKETHYYTVEKNAFKEVKLDASASLGLMKYPLTWDSNSSDDDLLETLAKALKKSF